MFDFGSLKKVFNPFGILLVFSILIVLPQFSDHAIILGADSLFHFNRFFDAEEQIAHHNLSYFISVYGFSQSGRIVNALYGPYIAYFNGFLLYLTKSWFLYQILSNVLVTLLAGLSMYYLLISNKIKYTYFLSIMYMMTYGVTTWITGQQFLSWGAMLMPLVVALGSRLIRSDEDKQISIIEMTSVMSIMLQTHMLSALFSVLLLIPFFIVAVVISKRRKILFEKLGISILLTIVLTTNIWISLISIYTQNFLVSPFENLSPMQNGVVNFMEDGRLYWTFVLLYVVQLGNVVINRNRVSFVNKFVTILGALLLFLTLPLVPWNYIFIHIPFIKTIQFPYRLLPISDTLLLFGVGLSLGNFITSIPNKTLTFVKYASLVLVVFTLFNLQSGIYKASTVWQSTENIIFNKGNVFAIENGDKLRDLFQNHDLGKPLSKIWKPSSDYLPTQKNAIVEHPYYQYHNEIANNLNNKKKIVDKRLTSFWYADSHSVGKYHNTGLVKYHDTLVRRNGKILKSDNFRVSSIGTIFVKSDAGINRISVSYSTSLLTKVVIIINVISWLIYIVSVLMCIFLKLFRDKRLFTSRANY